MKRDSFRAKSFSASGPRNFMKEGRATMAQSLRQVLCFQIGRDCHHSSFSTYGGYNFDPALNLCLRYGARTLPSEPQFL